MLLRFLRFLRKCPAEDGEQEISQELPHRLTPGTLDGIRIGGDVRYFAFNRMLMMSGIL